MIAVTLAVFVLFVWMYISAHAELPSVDSGTNLLVTSVMVLIVFLLVSFSSLTVAVDESYVRIKFGWGIFRKKFLLNEIASARPVKNQWYYGWGVRVLFRPYMWIYNVSGFDAVEITMKSGKMYRIGTDAPKELEAAIRQAIYI